MVKFFILLALAVLIFISIIVFRTFTFESKQLSSVSTQESVTITEKALDRLSGAIQIQTISYDDPALKDTSAFLRFHQYLQDAYPLVHQHLQKEVVSKYSLLYHWPGTGADTLKPLLLTAHMDVVPVESASLSQWEYAPFSGEIAQGFIWGRGTLDDKISVIALLESVEKLLAEGYVPNRDIYLAFGHDEEIGGNEGASVIASLLKSRGIHFELTLDEGGTITQGIVPSMDQPVALIGTAEKGFTALELTVEEDGGHSSMPKTESAVNILTRALVALQDNPFKARISDPVKDFAAFIGPEFPFIQKMAFANLWLFDGMIIRQYQKTASGAATVQTTIAPTILQSGIKENLIPTIAKATINFRILPGESTDDIVAHVKNIIGDERVKIAASEFSSEPSPVSSTRSAGFRNLQETISEVFPKTIVSPYLMLGATDGRYYAPVSDNVYRFIPLKLTSADLDRIHGINERISIENFRECIQFYYHFIKKLSK